MIRRALMALLLTLAPAQSFAQDVPGIEICTVEKTMERRTSCLQSNVDFLNKTIDRMRLDQQQRLAATIRQIDMLKAALTAQQTRIDELQAALAKPAPPPKDAPPNAPAKDTPPATPAAK